MKNSRRGNIRAAKEGGLSSCMWEFLIVLLMKDMNLRKNFLNPSSWTSGGSVASLSRWDKTGTPCSAPWEGVGTVAYRYFHRRQACFHYSSHSSCLLHRVVLSRDTIVSDLSHLHGWRYSSFSVEKFGLSSPAFSSGVLTVFKSVFLQYRQYPWRF